jgi:putative transposase
VRQPKWPPALVEAVETVRADNPMWEKRKTAALLNREGQAVSTSIVGASCGGLVPVPILRRRPGADASASICGQRYAKRLAKDARRARPGELVQIDTLFVNLRFRQGDQTLHCLLDKLLLAHPSK